MTVDQPRSLRVGDRVVETVTRYVVTHENDTGQRMLSEPMQGRYTYATEAEAQEWIDALRANSSDRLAEVYGARGADTLAVRPCQCWPGHFDPVGGWFDS